MWTLEQECLLNTEYVAVWGWGLHNWNLSDPKDFNYREEIDEVICSCFGFRFVFGRTSWATVLRDGVKHEHGKFLDYKYTKQAINGVTITTVHWRNKAFSYGSKYVIFRRKMSAFTEEEGRRCEIKDAIWAVSRSSGTRASKVDPNKIEFDSPPATNSYSSYAPWTKLFDRLSTLVNFVWNVKEWLLSLLLLISL